MPRYCIHQSFRLAAALRNSCQGGRVSALFHSNRKASQAATGREWSSPELATIAENIRTKIIIPKRLNRAQQRLIFGTKNKERLEHDPIYATVGDEEVRLRHVRVTKDIPRTWNVFNNVILLSKDEQDFQNIVRMLKDFKQANIVPRPGWLVKLARYMISKGMLPLLMQALRAAEKTQMSLEDKELLRVVLFGIRKNAEELNWDLAAVQKSLRYAEEVMTMLENPVHGRGRVSDMDDPRTSPDIFGFVVELAGYLVNKHSADTVHREKFDRFVERLLSMFKEQDILEQDVPQKNSRTLLAFIKRWTPPYQALMLAAKSQILDSLHRSQSQDRAETLGRRISEAESEFMEWLSKESPRTNVDMIEPLRSWRNRER